MSRPVFSCITSILNIHPHHAHLLCTISAENHLTQSPPFPLSVSTINLSSSLSNPTQNGSRHLHNVYRKALVAEIDCKAGNDGRPCQPNAQRRQESKCAKNGIRCIDRPIKSTAEDIGGANKTQCRRLKSTHVVGEGIRVDRNFDFGSVINCQKQIAA